MPRSALFMPVLGLLIILAVAGCYPLVNLLSFTGSGNLSTRSYDFRDFTAVDAGSSFQVQITQGTKYSVSVTADDNLWDRINVDKEGQTLHFDLKQPASYNNVTLRAQVTMPSIQGVTVSGASKATLQGFTAQDAVRAEASGASRIEGGLPGGNLNLTLSGASQANLAGSAGSLQLVASGASGADLSKYPVDRANVNLSGASNATINVKTALDYDLSGASHLNYSGNPQIGRSQTSGASSANHQ